MVKVRIHALFADITSHVLPINVNFKNYLFLQPKFIKHSIHDHEKIDIQKDF